MRSWSPPHRKRTQWLGRQSQTTEMSAETCDKYNNTHTHISVCMLHWYRSYRCVAGMRWSWSTNSHGMSNMDLYYMRFWGSMHVYDVCVYACVGRVCAWCACVHDVCDVCMCVRVNDVCVCAWCMWCVCVCVCVCVRCACTVLDSP